ncbi:sulfate/molybdate ABC transporter ATP-binding protein [Allofournierella massiliensis]|uniref:sulfate/molybdate ABC transporter ATP-binding protein n=1 Tax=Allofournierella massiliensis TaxID=1650663 RepID=UPI0024B0B252|nr:ATP-binding cassette domain-containing protein [Fournierella massiliensis]
MSLFVDIEKDLGSFHLKVSLETDGGITGLLGASGCGKSMTLRCIAGVETPDRGRIVLDGRTLFDSEQRINLPPQQRGVGYLFQSYALFPTMTVRQNLLAGLHREKDKARKQTLYRQAVELLGLAGLEQRRPAELSGGQQQRVALGRILVNRPQVLLLDEPFSALDSHLREQLQLDMLRVLKDFSGDVLLVTHSRDEAYHMCGRLAILDEGQLLRCGATKEVFADPGSRTAARLTGCKNIAAARRTGPNTVWVEDWGIQFTTARPVPEDLCAIGIRAHYFHPKAPANRFEVEYTGQIEEPFEWIIQMRTPNQTPGTPDIWWRMAKDKRPNPLPAQLGVAPENILLLTR